MFNNIRGIGAPIGTSGPITGVSFVVVVDPHVFSESSPQFESFATFRPFADVIAISRVDRLSMRYQTGAKSTLVLTPGPIALVVDTHMTLPNMTIQITY